MKTVLFYVLCFAYFFINAQDTIYKRNGELIVAKVLEINTKEISYKRTDLLDGPLFIINKNEIKKIKYVTGTIDSFKVVIEEAKKPTVMYNPAVIISENNQIQNSNRRGVYLYREHHISDRRVLFLAHEKNQVWKDKEIELNITSSKRNKTLQYVIGFGGAAVGIVGLYSAAIATSFSSNSSDNATIAIAALASVGLVVSSQIVSFSYKLKRIKHSDKVVELYNQYSKN